MNGSASFGGGGVVSRKSACVQLDHVLSRSKMREIIKPLGIGNVFANERTELLVSRPQDDLDTGDPRRVVLRVGRCRIGP